MSSRLYMHDVGQNGKRIAISARYLKKDDSIRLTISDEQLLCESQLKPPNGQWADDAKLVDFVVEIELRAEAVEEWVSVLQAKLKQRSEVQAMSGAPEEPSE